MLIVNRLGEDAGRYYLPGTVPGRWCGGGRHEVGLDGRVTAGALDAVLKGRDPTTGDSLSARRVPHRRAGTDLIFTAPKSVSLLAALAPEGDVARAHLRACADAFVWLEQHGCWARRGGRSVATSGFVGARFGHRLSAAGEPHLHTHVLVGNLVRADDGRWSALDGSGIWLNQRAVAAVYHLGLRQQLLAAGLRPNWEIRPDGTADIADIPSAAIEATSSRRRQIRARIGGEDDPAPRRLTAAQRTTREQAPESLTWLERSTNAGFGTREARELIDDARRRAAPGLHTSLSPERLSTDVVDWLDRRRSTFGVPDVMQALAASHSEGAAAADAHRWARAFLDASPMTGDGRRTSELSAARDRALADLAVTRAGPGPVDPMSPHDRLVHDGNGVDVVGRPDPLGGEWPVARRWGGFVAQAATIGAAAAEWRAGGRTVAVDTTSMAAARRWEALTGLGRHAEGSDLPGVLVVDRADRRSTSELLGLVREAADRDTKLVLVEGGTLPARRASISRGLDEIADRSGRVVPGAERTRPGPENGLSADETMDRVITSWEGFRQAGAPARMVALGPAECDELNRRARTGLRREGGITGPEVMIAGRPYAVGDDVVTTRRGSVPAGSMGKVRAVDRTGAMTVDTPDGALAVDARAGRSLRHAYAVTPGILRFDDRPVVVLGRSVDLGRHAGRVVAASEVERDVALVPEHDHHRRLPTPAERGLEAAAPPARDLARLRSGRRLAGREQGLDVGLGL